MRKTTTKKKPVDSDSVAQIPDRKTVGVPLGFADLEALLTYRDREGARTLVRPKEGPAAAAIFRAGLVALKLVTP